MPLSTSVLKCAISLVREGPGSCFTISGLLSVKLVPSVWEEKGQGVVLHQPVCSVLHCAISMGREWPGRCFAPTGLLNIYAVHMCWLYIQFGGIFGECM